MKRLKGNVLTKMKFMCCILCCACIFLCACTEEEAGNIAVNAKETHEQYDTEKENEEYIRLANEVTREMLSADYWLKEEDSADNTKVLMTEEEITNFNTVNSKMITTKSGLAFGLSDIGEVFEGEIVRELVNTYVVPKEAENTYLDGQLTDEKYWNGLIKNMNVENISDEVHVKFGFSVQRTNVRVFPTNDFISEDSDDLLYDELARGECMPYEPLVILHESTDGEWYYVALYGYAGWIEKEYVALCDTRKQWLERQDMDCFLVVTGREMRLNHNPYSADTSSLLLPMGTRLQLVSPEEAPDAFDGRTGEYNYIVKVPVRLEDGRIGDKYVLIPVSEDVHVGYLSYTHENVLRLAFKLLGDRYGWAGMYYANDCSGIVNEIFRCFGINLPRSGKAQIDVSGVKYIDVSRKSDRAKLSALKEIPLGSLLYFPGHIMIYLGVEEDIPYVISSVGSYCTVETGAGNPIEVNSVVINSLTGTIRGNGSSWLKCITDILVCEPD